MSAKQRYQYQSRFGPPTAFEKKKRINKLYNSYNYLEKNNYDNKFLNLPVLHLFSLQMYWRFEFNEQSTYYVEEQ